MTKSCHLLHTPFWQGNLFLLANTILRNQEGKISMFGLAVMIL